MNTAHFKEKLEAELKEVEAELSTVGEQIHPEVGDWEGKAPDMDTMSPMADSNEAADKLEEYDTNRSINDNLEVRFREIRAALRRIEDGSYGICEISGEEIEEERLEANPSARTCIAHKEDQHELPPLPAE